MRLAKASGDQLLNSNGLLVEADIVGQRRGDVIPIVREVVETLREGRPELHAGYEKVVANALVRGGLGHEAQHHYDRARRIYQGLHSVPGLLELDRSWNDAKSAAETNDQAAGPAEADGPDSAAARLANNQLQNVASLMLHAGRPELLATGLVAILADTACVDEATAVSRGGDGSVEILASYRPMAGGQEARGTTRTIPLGNARGRVVEVTLRPHHNLEAAATLNALTLLLGTVTDLERAHLEREERLTLWPIEDAAGHDDQTIVMGRLGELMTYARRVAKTNVSVLLTGESGTGKEIIARAIHAYSDRAQKPFVPFNCTAIPREMLESQLFGHRRGSFTGADRDYIGMIRAARDGTLFLDEIGELGLDLQPKLLRFLESGEINPLGEPSPFNVNVRIVAATNSNLERLVQEGRFREDLFYRLNVIRLTVPPLRERRDEIPALVHHFVARAAKEFGKGRVRVAEETMEHLLLFDWPGNVRQLHNELRRMVALAESDSVLTPAAISREILRATPKHIPRAGGPELAVPLTDKLQPTLSRIEREMIKAALRTNQGKVDAAASCARHLAKGAVPEATTSRVVMGF